MCEVRIALLPGLYRGVTKKFFYAIWGAEAHDLVENCVFSCRNSKKIEGICEVVMLRGCEVPAFDVQELDATHCTREKIAKRV